MARYVYSIIRCVPEPRTGEFVNIAAIAGDPETGDWGLRQVANESRVRKLASPATIGAVHGFIARMGEVIDVQDVLLEEGGDPLDENWLETLVNESRNIVQLSAPMPLLAENAEDALDVVFGHLIIDPTVHRRGFVTKHTVISELRQAYRDAEIKDRLVQAKVELYAGDKVHTPIDFAIANGHVYQVCQGWSFQKAGVDDVAIEVKAWGYALRRVRDGDEARILGSGDHVSTIDRNVDLEVLVAPPKTSEQERVFEEASQVFSDLDVQVTEFGDAEAVGRRAAELVEAGSK